MRRPLCTVLVSFLLFAKLLEAQESKSQSSESGLDNTTAISLLQQSHDIGQQLPVPMRLMNLLPRQAEMVSRLRPDLGREWANELLTLSSQAKGSLRTSTQNAAIGMLIRFDRDSGRALALLHSLNIEEPVPKWATSPPEMQLVHQLFQMVVQHDGPSALPLLQQEAEHLGAQGHYPYAALGYAAMQATLKDWGSDNQHAIRVLQSVFEPAFARYSQNPHSYYDDFDFGRMLQVLAGALPFDSVQPALRLLVKNLLATDTSKYQFELDGYTSDGKIIKAHNAIDATILFLGTLVSRDPELVQQLQSTRPELQTSLEYAKSGPPRSMSLGSPRSSPTPEQQTRTDAVHLSTLNPEAAIAQAQQLPEDQRASTMLDIARNFSGDYPERAAELIAEIQAGNKPINDETSVNLISAQAFVAAAQKKRDQLRELLQRGFELANRVILEQQRTGDIHFFTGLGPLVQVGVDNDPDVTIPFIESLSPSYVKAQLLLIAGSDLSMGTRVPLRFHPQQKVEKPAQ
ncbi:MAG TPA: hypothetical protein VN943_12880 [Candidatus Acidoferrum sp.]|nr:hypothetical protein [Candidatus Acidoferrum sp.]